MSTDTGVGGLLSLTIHRSGGATVTYVPTYDSNGNITAYVDAGTAQVAATFEYAPFGAVLGVWYSSDTVKADLAAAPRFSTKLFDTISGLYYFGSRWYDPATGRWLSRDPLGEQGGLNLYAYCQNDPINKNDPLGLVWWNPLDHDFAIWQAGLAALDLQRDLYGTAGQIAVRMPYAAKSAASFVVKEALTFPIDTFHAYASTASYEYQSASYNGVVNMTRSGQWRAGQIAREGVATVSGYRAGEAIGRGAVEYVITGDNTQFVDATAGVLGPALFMASIPVRPGVGPVGTPVSAGDLAATSAKPPWLSWSQYEKVTVGGTEYAKVGNRLYTRHAAERTYPSGLGAAAGGVKGRSVAPAFVEDVLDSPQTVRTPVVGPLGQVRVSHLSGSLEVITEGDIVITVIVH